MNAAEFSDLETQIDVLLDNLNRLKNENQTLRNQLAASAHERSVLQQKNREAAMKIRRIITQLKEGMIHE